MRFSKFGELAEVNILKKPDGKLVGCAFVQFKNINNAAKAMKETNAKPFMGRPIAVDWAVPKEVFKGPPKNNVEKEEIKDEDIKEEEIKEEIKEEPVDEDEPEVKQEKDDEDNNEADSEEERQKSSRVPHNLSTGHDIDEGKTVFIKNLAYETDEEDLRDMMEELFGPVHFAKLVP